MVWYTGCLWLFLLQPHLDLKCMGAQLWECLPRHTLFFSIHWVKEHLLSYWDIIYMYIHIYILYIIYISICYVEIIKFSACGFCYNNEMPLEFLLLCNILVMSGPQTETYFKFLSCSSSNLFQIPISGEKDISH